MCPMDMTDLEFIPRAPAPREEDASVELNVDFLEEPDAPYVEEPIEPVPSFHGLSERVREDDSDLFEDSDTAPHTLEPEAFLDMLFDIEDPAAREDPEALAEHLGIHGAFSDSENERPSMLGCGFSDHDSVRCAEPAGGVPTVVHDRCCTIAVTRSLLHARP